MGVLPVGLGTPLVVPEVLGGGLGEEESDDLGQSHAQSSERVAIIRSVRFMMRINFSTFKFSRNLLLILNFAMEGF